MTLNQVRSILRALVPAILAFAVGRGWLGSEAAADVTAAIVALGAAVWGAFENQPKQLVAKVAAMPDKVVSDIPPAS